MTLQPVIHIDAGAIVDSLPVHKDFKQVIEYALAGFDESWWIKLPLLSCEAVGGPQSCGELLAGAVGLAATSAEILDDIQDRDTDKALWRQIGVAQALNVGISLIFAGQVLLARLEEHGVLPSVVSMIQKRYMQVGLTMCSGQHHDLADNPLSLDQYWEMAEAKTGAFAAWCCEAGGMLGSSESSIAELAVFGRYLGLLHQMKNDLNGLYGWAGKGDLLDGKRTTLPMVYAFSVAPPGVKENLEELLRTAVFQTEARRSIQIIIVQQLGFTVFAKMVAEHHYQAALEALQATRISSHIFDSFHTLLDHAVSLMPFDE
jgi:geranylgeranyl pyrophosphate synthase